MRRQYHEPRVLMAAAVRAVACAGGRLQCGRAGGIMRAMLSLSTPPIVPPSLVSRFLRRTLRATPGRLLGLLSAPPLLLAVIVLCAMVGFRAGDSLGAPDLFWNEAAWVQFVNGLFFGLVFVHVGLIAFVLEVVANPAYEQTHADPSCALTPEQTLVSYVVSIGLCGLVAIVLGARSAPFHGVPVLLGAPTVVVGALFLLARVHRHRLQPLDDVIRAIADKVNVCLPSETAMSKNRIAILTSPRHVVTQLAFFVPLVVIYVLSALTHAVPALACACCLIIIANAVWGFFAAWAGSFRTAWCLAVVGVVLAAGVARDPVLRIRPLMSTRGHLVSDEGALAAWKDHARALRPLGSVDMKPPLVIVATSGGGIRAATWTTSVLLKLDRCFPALIDHIRVIAGASGGMVGASHFVAHFQPGARAAAGGLEQPGRVDEPAERLLSRVASDSLTPILRTLVLPTGDRGQALEDAWIKADPAVGQAMSALADDEERGARPSLIFSPMQVEDGRRLLVSNLDLSSITAAQSDAPLGSRHARASITAVQLFTEIAGAQDGVSLATAALMNATFPWVTGARRLPTRPTRRIVDAGYYDNYGVDVASLWLHKNAAWLAENTSGVLLVQIRDDQQEKTRTNVNVPAGPSGLASVLSPLATPVAAVLSARSATMSFRNDELLSIVRGAMPRPDFVTTVLIELDSRAPLGWYLSTEQERAIASALSFPPSTDDEAIGGDLEHKARVSANRRAFLHINEWWKRTAQATPQHERGALPESCLGSL